MHKYCCSQFVLACHGHLGQLNHVQNSQHVFDGIRKEYPDPDGQYTGHFDGLAPGDAEEDNIGGDDFVGPASSGDAEEDNIGGDDELKELWEEEEEEGKSKELLDEDETPDDEDDSKKPKKCCIY